MVGVLSFARGLFDREPIENGNTSYKHFLRLKPNHIVMSQLFGWEGALALSDDRFAGKYLSPQFPTFLSDEGRLNRKFLGWLMRRPGFWSDLGMRASGMGDRRRTLNPDAFFACQIPLPPLDEQRRIVARIEELASRISTLRKSRKEAQRECDAVTRAVLHRKFGRPNGTASGKSTVFKWVRLQDVCNDVADGPHLTPTYMESGIPFITVLNITSGKVDFTNHKYVSREAHAQFSRRARAERGDVLISKDGTIGVPCFIDTDKEFSFFVSVALVKPKRDLLDGQFLTWVLRAPYMQERIQERSRGDMIRHLVLREIRQLEVPLLPLKEQREIVAELDSLQAKVEAVKALQAETAAGLDAMLPAILDRAFKGEL